MWRSGSQRNSRSYDSGHRLAERAREMAMTSILGFGFDAELDYRRERLRADFRRVHGSDRRRWWQRRRTDRVAELSTPIRTRSIHGVDAMGVTADSGVTN